MMSKAASALTLLTALRVPGQRVRRVEPDVAAYFPWIGMLLGIGASLALFGLDRLSVAFGTGWLLDESAYLLGALIVLAWAVSTRFLHWDGLADVADALWLPGSLTDRLAVMEDSATGAFGATAVALVALVQTTSLGVVLSDPDPWWLVAVVPLFGRTAATVAAWLGRSARPGGLGSSIMGRPTPAAMAVFGLGVVLSAPLLWAWGGTAGLVLAVLALVAAAVVPHLIAARIGGVTGDVMGASILVTESTLLVCAAVWSAL
jgi:adenosylcobinamide-GDP ribazoletransferase